MMKENWERCDLLRTFFEIILLTCVVFTSFLKHHIITEFTFNSKQDKDLGNMIKIFKGKQLLHG